MSAVRALGRDLAAIVGADAVREGQACRPYLSDASASRGLAGGADAVVLPSSQRETAAVVAWACEHDVPMTTRGGGTGFSGGAVPHGGIVIAMERMHGVRAIDPGQWRMHVDCGLSTRHVHRLAREAGLWFPPDPGAAEQSQIGGNAATNAGGPHAFKYGVTGDWVTGVEAVVAPGETISVGGPIRKDAAGYDLRGLLVGSEGTLGIITGLWLSLIPPPAAALPVVAFYPDLESGCRAVEAAMASGTVPAAIEYLDAVAARIALPAFPGTAPAEPGFAVIAEADGTADEAAAGRALLIEALAGEATATVAPESPAAVADLWRWRDGVSTAVDAHLGGKVSEDICVPGERLAEAVAMTVEIGARHGLEACSWGHAGDGNLHSTFMIAREDAASSAAVEAARQELFALAVKLGGTVSGEHGLGRVKSGQLRRQWSPAAVELHAGVKRLFDPKGLFNPGVKLA